MDSFSGRSRKERRWDLYLQTTKTHYNSVFLWFCASTAAESSVHQPGRLCMRRGNQCLHSATWWSNISKCAEGSTTGQKICFLSRWRVDRTTNWAPNISEADSNTQNCFLDALFSGFCVLFWSEYTAPSIKKTHMYLMMTLFRTHKRLQSLLHAFSVTYKERFYD